MPPFVNGEVAHDNAPVPVEISTDRPGEMCGQSCGVVGNPGALKRGTTATPPFHEDVLSSQVSPAGRIKSGLGIESAGSTDGSARYIKWGKTLDPVNLFFVFPETRRLGSGGNPP